jgi:hypothetical protein
MNKTIVLPACLVALILLLRGEVSFQNAGIGLGLVALRKSR